MKISIVIPARNEAGNIEKTVAILRDHLDISGIPTFEILVVDDGSTDTTYPLVQAEHEKDSRIRIVQNNGKHGYGYAVRFGLDHFTGDAVIVYMADASDAPEDVAKYYYILRDEADCAFGSRFIRGSRVHNYPHFKLIINRIANFMIRMLFWLPLNDFTNAFKGYRADVIKGCQPFISPHFNLTIEIPLKAIVRGYSYKVVPISWRNRNIGVSHLKLKEQGSRYLFTLLTVWFEYLLTRNDYRRDVGEKFTPWDELEQQKSERLSTSTLGGEPSNASLM